VKTGVLAAGVLPVSAGVLPVSARPTGARVLDLGVAIAPTRSNTSELCSTMSADLIRAGADR